MCEKNQKKNEASIYIGSKLGGGGPTINLYSRNFYLKNNCAVVCINGIKVVITERRRPFHYLKDFVDLGIELKDFHLLVVKSGYLSPELQRNVTHDLIQINNPSF